MKKIFYMGKEYAGFTDNAMDMTNPKIDLASYGTSPTSGGTVTKVVTTNGGNFKRVNGAYVVVTFANANTGSVSLNVDGTGSKYAYYNGSRLNASNGNFSAGETVTFMYDGTYYQRLDTDTDDTSILKSLANLGWSDVLSSGMLIVKKLLAKVLTQINKSKIKSFYYTGTTDTAGVLKIDTFNSNTMIPVFVSSTSNYAEGVTLYSVDGKIYTRIVRYDGVSLPNTSQTVLVWYMDK